MVICLKCGKEQTRRSGAGCEYDLVIDNVSADKSLHAWMDRDEFINEIREKLLPFIKERIADLQRKLAKNKKKLDELQAAYAVYLNEELPRDAKRLFISEMIGSVIGVVVGILLILFPFKWLISIILNILNEFGLKIHPFIVLLMQVLMLVLMLVYVVYFIRKPIVKYLKTIDCAKSQSQEYADKLANEWVDKLARKWLDDNGLNKLRSDIEYNIIMFEARIKNAERALVGSDEELLDFYNEDKKTKSWYIGKIYEGAW
ncbi:hypothetical protein [Treponema sp. R80B11-R83G3]